MTSAVCTVSGPLLLQALPRIWSKCFDAGLLHAAKVSQFMIKEIRACTP